MLTLVIVLVFAAIATYALVGKQQPKKSVEEQPTSEVASTPKSPKVVSKETVAAVETVDEKPKKKKAAKSKK